MNRDNSKALVIFLGTFNGERFLSEQLDSFWNQTYENWRLVASDDGSTDQTRAILHQYQQAWGPEKLCTVAGPGLGFCENFLSMVCQSQARADLYAYSDQDDIWEAFKLDRAVEWFASVPVSVPALFLTRTRLIDEFGRALGLSPLFVRPPSFQNALVQSLGGGNTMVFNQAARELLKTAGPTPNVFAHDWWTYLLVTAAGGRVFFDPVPSVLYRQHQRNIMGMNVGLHAQFRRLKLLFGGKAKDWIRRNLAALQRNSNLIMEPQLKTLFFFSEALNKGIFARLAGFSRSGVYRQTRVAHFALLIAIILKRV